MWIDTLKPEHHEALYEVSKKSAPARPFQSFVEFEAWMEGGEGFVVVRNDGILAGCVYFTRYVPMVDILIHAFVDQEFRGRWITRGMVKKILDYPFESLFLPRVSAYYIPDAGIFDTRPLLAGLGFKHEGTIRKGMRINGAYYDVMLYGLLKDQRRVF